ncbi:MAG: hypothetical protein ABR980_05195 [Ignavibacteriaceae bacterium]|jgi:hypothetical protein
MRLKYLFIVFLGIALFVSSNFTFSQTINNTAKASTTISGTTNITGEVGKIYTKAEADSLYGPVLKADNIKTDDLAKLAENSPKYMMFNLIEGKACILNASREVISSNSLVVSINQTIEPTQVFRLFSTSKVLELIKQGGSDVTTIETRANVLTLNNGNTILELSLPCPPICPF